MEHDNPIGEDDAAQSNGRIPLIKIKIPKKAEEEEEREEVKSHYCKECKKSFNSGKALGGHMSSAHVQANKDYSFKKPSSKRKSPGSGSASAAANACMLCGRVFQSKKSLFGHMRCHPEREWRGMEPPPEMKIDSDDDGGDEDQIDSGHELGFFNLKGWPTSKRGRGPVCSNPESKEAESFVAGLELIKMLKEDGGPKLEPEPDDPRREMKGKEADPSDELYITAIQVLVSGKRERVDKEKQVIMGDPETTSSSPDKYKCNQCARVFSTHQALGGHRSSHNKFKMTVVNTNTRDQYPQTKTTKTKTKKKKNAGNAAAFAFDLNMAPAEEEEEEMEDSSNHTSSNS